MQPHLSVQLVLLVAAAVCFGVSAAGVPVPRFNLIALGLLLWVLTLLVPAH